MYRERERSYTYYVIGPVDERLGLQHAWAPGKPSAPPNIDDRRKSLTIEQIPYYRRKSLTIEGNPLL